MAAALKTFFFVIAEEAKKGVLSVVMLVYSSLRIDVWRGNTRRINHFHKTEHGTQGAILKRKKGFFTSLLPLLYPYYIFFCYNYLLLLVQCTFWSFM